MKKRGFIFGLMLLQVSCSVEPTDPGLCELNCSKAYIGPIEAEIETVHVTQDVVCAAASALTAFNDPILFQFRVSELVQLESGQQRVPLRNVSIEPIVFGLRSEEPQHNPNVEEIEAGVFSPARYKGIVTPSSNWCSDACGVVSLEIVPLCPAQGESNGVSVLVHSGPLYSPEYSLEVSTEDPSN